MIAATEVAVIWAGDYVMFISCYVLYLSKYCIPLYYCCSDEAGNFIPASTYVAWISKRRRRDILYLIYVSGMSGLQSVLAGKGTADVTRRQLELAAPATRAQPNRCNVKSMYCQERQSLPGGRAGRFGLYPIHSLIHKLPCTSFRVLVARDT